MQTGSGGGVMRVSWLDDGLLLAGAGESVQKSGVILARSVAGHAPAVCIRGRDAAVADADDNGWSVFGTERPRRDAEPQNERHEDEEVVHGLAWRVVVSKGHPMVSSFGFAVRSLLEWFGAGVGLGAGSTFGLPIQFATGLTGIGFL